MILRAVESMACDCELMIMRTDKPAEVAMLALRSLMKERHSNRVLSCLMIFNGLCTCVCMLYVIKMISHE